jgi:Phage tail lysozyme
MLADCSPNDQHAFDYLVGKGLTDFQAAGVIGNLEQESAMNTHALGDNGQAHGIAQWAGQRWQGALALASQTGRDVYSLDLQLDFLWHELQTYEHASYLALTSAQSLDTAVVAFQDKFERCGACNTPRRIALARMALVTCSRITPPIPSGGGGSSPLKGFVIGAALAAAAAIGYAAYEGATR